MVMSWGNHPGKGSKIVGDCDTAKTLTKVEGQCGVKRH